MPAEAEPLFLEAETLYRELGEDATLDLANTLRGLALVNQSLRKPDVARARWVDARALYAQCNIDAAVAECDKQMARV